MEQQTLSGIAGSNFGNSYLIEKKFEVMLESLGKKLVSEISSIKETINSLQSEIGELKRSHAQAPAQNVPQSPVIQAKAESPSLRPRYGDYNPQDVAVEKMFYFGNRR